EFILLILAGNMIAWPIAFFIMNKWLQNFEYRIDIGVPNFVITGLIVIGIAAVTICIQVLKAAMANPVDSIRYE
ncbi:hypothetical protein ACFL6G_09955, partial [candidate division KSB1 bacterium]